MRRTIILGKAFILFVVPAISMSAGAQVQQQGASAGAGTLALAGLPSGVREAMLASIDARQNLQEMGSYEQASRALRLDSTFGLARVLRTAVGSGSPAEVEAEYRRGLADALGRTPAEQAYAMGLRATGANATRLLGVAREMMPNDRRVALDHALSFGERARVDSLRSLVRQYPDFIAPRLWLAYYESQWIYTRSPAELYEALTVAEDAMRRAPTLSSSHTILAHTLYRLGRLDEAVAHLAAATKLDPRAEYAYSLEAEIFAADGKPHSVDRSRAALDSAIAACPNAGRRTFWKRRRALMLFYDGRKAEGKSELNAVARASEAAGMAGTAANVYAQLALLAAGTGDTADVEHYLAESRRVQPSGNVTNALAALALAHKPVAARRELNEFLEGSTDTTSADFISDRHALTGMTLLAEGKPADALEELRRSNSDNSYAQLAMIDAYAMMNNKSAATALQTAMLARPSTIQDPPLAVLNYRARKR